MQISEAGLNLIKRCEGFRSFRYEDVAGLPTIGYGHKLEPGESFPSGVTLGKALDLLVVDVHTAENAVMRLVKVQLAQGQFDALVDFTFNLGAGRLASSTLLRDLNFAQYDAAAEQLLKWDHSGLREIPALEARRSAEYKLWYLGAEPTPTPATATAQPAALAA